MNTLKSTKRRDISETKRRRRYKETRLYVPEVGYLKFLRFKDENGEEEYVGTTKLDMCPKSTYRHKKKIWKIEEMHEQLKNYFGLEECYSGKEEAYYAYLTIPPFLDILVL